MLNRILLLALGSPIALSLVSLPGCSTKAPQQTAVMQSVGDLGVTGRRIRVGATNLLNTYMSNVEVSADGIIAATTDPGVRYNALVWKANAIPAFQRAMFHPDPLVSFVDGWTLSVQMREYFEAGGGRDLFGPQQPIAVTTSRQLELATDSAVATKLEPAVHDRMRRFVYTWAEQYPLDNPLFLRRSVAEAAADVLGAERLGGMSTLGSMAEMAQDAQQMALVFASYMPKEVRWQSELLIASLTDSLRFNSLLAAIDRMEVMEETARFLRETPGLLASERAQVFRDISEERLETMREIDRQRLATLQEIVTWARSEREAMLVEMARMVADEREAVFADVDQITRGIVDHIFLRLVQIGVVLAVLVLVGLWLVGRTRASPTAG
ncbi:MAG TPA: hypothetical protein VLC48_11195 [Gemmatimonadota bacterium]|nr:hypothetical protein [Gemmatimonadota bacterium]